MLAEPLIPPVPGQRLLREIQGREQDRATVSRVTQDLQETLQVSCLIQLVSLYPQPSLPLPIPALPH